MPRSTTPALSVTFGFLRLTTAFRTGWRRRLPGNIPDFGAQSRGLFTRCVHFTPWVTPRQRNTRFQPGTTLCWTGLRPVGSRWKVSNSDSLCHRLSPFQSFLAFHPCRGADETTLRDRWRRESSLRSELALPPANLLHASGVVWRVRKVEGMWASLKSEGGDKNEGW